MSNPSSKADEPKVDDNAIVPASAADAANFAIRNSGLGSDSVTAFVRWFQLESWLRQLAYIELRSSAGLEWDKLIEAGSIKRMEKDRAYPYMASPDLENPFAYVDASILFDLLEKYWELFDAVLIDKEIWVGRRAELVKIRHRIGHMRKPHRDDVLRLEQTLRDLEGGAFAALVSYNRPLSVSSVDSENDVISGWIQKKHPVARRLVDHAAQVRETYLELSVTRRPWTDGIPTSGREPGFLWRVEFHSPTRAIRLFNLWNDQRLAANVKPLLLHLHYTDPTQIALTFPAVDDPARVSDAIGDVFDAVISNSTPLNGDNFDFHHEMNKGQAAEYDFRVLIDSPWNLIDESMKPITIFGAAS